MASTSLVSALVAFALIAGCRPAPRTDPKTLFEQTVKQYHLPSAEAKGAERDALLAKAAVGYREVLKRHADQPYWCAQALRSLANVRVAQGRLDEAVTLYTQVGEKYPEQEWEVLQAWKSAADLLWEADRVAEARPFYQKIVTRFAGEDQPELVKVMVRAARRRLEGEQRVMS